jgi:type VI secretion system secreted protein Hcp
MAVFVKIDGVDGTSTHEKHKNWILVESLQWGVGRSLQAPTGATKQREASEPSVSDVMITKQTDGSSPKLFQMACGQEPEGKMVKIDFVQTGSPGNTYMTYKLHNALISEYRVSTGGELPEEEIGLNFTKVEVEYYPYDEKNNKGNTQRATYDLTTTKVG